MDAGLIIAIVVIALLVLAVIVLAGRKRKQRQERELARVQTHARRDDAQYERQSAGEKLAEAKEAEERARHARVEAERHEERATEVDPDIDEAQNGHHTDRDPSIESGRSSDERV